MRLPRLLPVTVVFLVGSLWATVAFGAIDVPLIVATVGVSGVAASVIATDLRGPWRALRAALAPAEQVTSRDRLALQQAARSGTVAGLALGVFAVLLLFATVRTPSVSPARVAMLVRWSLLGPLVGVFVGRLCVGSLVDVVGGARPATDRGTAFAVVAIAAIAFVSITLPQ